MASNKETVLKTLAVFIEEFRKVYDKDGAWMKRFTSGDNAPINEIIEKSCKITGVDVTEYMNFMQKDESLLLMQRQMINEVILGDIIKYFTTGEKPRKGD